MNYILTEGICNNKDIFIKQIKYNTIDVWSCDKVYTNALASITVTFDYDRLKDCTLEIEIVDSKEISDSFIRKHIKDYIKRLARRS